MAFLQHKALISRCKWFRQPYRMPESTHRWTSMPFGQKVKLHWKPKSGVGLARQRHFAIPILKKSNDNVHHFDKETLLHPLSGTPRGVEGVRGATDLVHRSPTAPQTLFPFRVDRVGLKCEITSSLDFDCELNVQ